MYDQFISPLALYTTLHTLTIHVFLCMFLPISISKGMYTTCLCLLYELKAVFPLLLSKNEKYAIYRKN